MQAEAVKMRVQADFYLCTCFCTKMQSPVLLCVFSKGRLKPGEVIKKIQGQEKKMPEHEKHKELSLFNLSKKSERWLDYAAEESL